MEGPLMPCHAVVPLQWKRCDKARFAYEFYIFVLQKKVIDWGVEKNRRKQPRFVVEGTLEVHYMIKTGVEQTSPVEAQARIRNIGTGGVQLDEVELPFGAEVRVKIFMPALKEHALLPATVRWVKEQSAGLQFGALRAKEVWAIQQMCKGAPEAD